jgi:AcrR family transcriptional regulator
MAKRDDAKTKAKRGTKPGKTKTAGKREKNKEQTKARILEAALKLFCEKGFYKTTTKEISKKARIAEGTLFNYFKTKEDLALYFFQTEAQHCMNWYSQDERVGNTPLPEKLFAIIQHYLDRMEPYQEFIGAVYLRALQPNSKLNPLSLEIQELRVRELRFITNILEEAEENGEIPPAGNFGPYAVGLLFFGILTYWLHDQSKDKENTMALMDRSLSLATHFLNQGGWEW